MSYKPPASRMRQLRADKPPRPQAPPDPINVEEALAMAAVEPEVVEPEVVEVPEPAPEPEVIVPEVTVVSEPEAVVEVPEYSMAILKADLLAIADSLGIKADESMTKAQIIELLDAATQ